MADPTTNRPRLRLSGDRGLLVEFGESIDPNINRTVRRMAVRLEREGPAGVLEVIPAYRSLMLVYDPAVLSPTSIEDRIFRLQEGLAQVELPEERTIEIPVCYGQGHGPDLSFVAEHNGLTEEEAVQLHSRVDYPIYMLGFTPGFPYLGGLDQRLHTPRRQTPRTRVPQGSVGIANAQTGIYPVSSPGGWQLIGRTPLRLFNPSDDWPVPYRPGDRLRFRPVSLEEYNRLAKDQDNA